MSQRMDKVKKVVDNVGQNSKVAAEKVELIAKEVTDKGKTVAISSKETVVKALDQNGDGVVDSTDIILLALKTPGVKIKRDKFLTKELSRYCSSETVEKAIKSTPLEVGIDSDVIEKIANDVIAFERNAVSGISTLLGVPGGAAMAATIPADVAQYYGYMLRAAQKLMYLYGFPELNTDGEDVNLDTGTINTLTVCLGIMYGVAGANNAMKAMAKALATGVEKQLMKKALTKGAIYPIVKSISKWFGVHMTKEVFAGFFKKSIPVVGGVIGGGLTFATFKPCCIHLKNALCDTSLSNPDHIESYEEQEIYNDIRMPEDK